MCYFQKTEIRKLRKTADTTKKTKIIFGLSTPKKHKETPKNQDIKNKTKNLLPSVMWIGLLHLLNQSSVYEIEYADY